MKLKRVLLSFVALALCLPAAQSVTASSSKNLLAVGDTLPEITLLSPESPAHKAYLGLSGEGSFQIPDIKADAVIVEIFSMYCPHCQKEAPVVNKLYELIENNPTAKDRVKLIGIGARNDIYEVDFFRKKYDIQFPLFDDEDYSKHEACGEPGTPFFFVVKIDKDGSSKVVHTQLGGFESPEGFLQTVIEKSGLR